MFTTRMCSSTKLFSTLLNRSESESRSSEESGTSEGGPTEEPKQSYVVVKASGLQVKRIRKEAIGPPAQPEPLQQPQTVPLRQPLQKPVPQQLTSRPAERQLVPKSKNDKPSPPLSSLPTETLTPPRPKIDYVTRPVPQVSRQLQSIPIYERTDRQFSSIPTEILKKAKAVKPSVEISKAPNGIPISMPAVTLVDEKGSDLVTLPWRVVSI